MGVGRGIYIEKGGAGGNQKLFAFFILLMISGAESRV